MNWQPIETAPMDGTPFLAWDGNTGIYVAYYSKSHKALIDQQLGEWPEYGPKLWHPLPPPPTVNESLTVPTDDELHAIQAEAYSAAKAEAYSALATLAMDNDLDEPLGNACSPDNPGCESCQ